ncbi:polysaccharide lyase [Eubacterium sp. AM46-8]|uniref:pectate lyase family protein n=1 Tax=Eubacterium sp. AM46-8 TaxID=2292350 RepID=UPI000E4A9D97|nr:polysaccharide lyase [Eubacterium sp. AM46-8]RGZ64569.1 polysaccharide lyase [Eubacterium sp. AM49-13BH]RGZ89393.1 polysaccharide lyase [Eubacterium sp. AM46-8]
MQKIRKVFAKVVAGLLVVSNLAIAAPSMTYAASATSFTTVGGWNEMMYATIKGVKDADVTAVSYSGPVSGSLTGEDFEYLVRDTSDGVRVDVMGLKPGTYTLTVTTKTGTYTQSGIEVNEQDRSGYAHYNYTDGVGAYNDDGTLKDNAIVLYVTDENKNTVTLSYGGVTVSGIGNILNSVGKACGEAGHETECKKVSKGKTYYGKGNTNQGILQLLAENNIPLVIRMVGAVSESGLYKTGTWAAANAGLIDGLTDYDCNDYGGSIGDNGHMARMKSAKDVTIEGVGTDAAMDGWGIHFMSETSTTAAGLGKSFEVRNLTFMNQPEDAIGMEGVQDGSVITAPVERCWIHNNEFYSPSITGPAESDKAEGDGSCDFKRGEYLTVSYNYFEGCHKTNLVGSSDTSLQYNLTYHHNIWKGCAARQPLGRQANMHFYNNQFIGTTDYAMNTRANAYIYSEYNLFFMTKNPMDVRSGAIKSYNDSFSSCIGSMTGTVVTDKSTKVTSGNKYENFDTNASLSYIPSGDYQLQTSVTDAAKVLKAYNGCMPENVKTSGEVTTSECSLLSYCAPGVTPINISEYPYTAAPGKISKTVYAFTVGGTVDVTVSFASEALTTTGCLVNESGECFQVGSGTVTGLPAGTYMIMPCNIQSGSNGVNPAAGTFKEMTINSITINAADPNAHYHHYVSEVTKQATCAEEGVITYTCIATNGTCDKKTYTESIPKTAHTYGEWVVEKEATETETGLKRHTCTVCGADQTAVIPVKGSEPDVPAPSEGSYVQNFTASGMTSDFYSITGSTSDSKGSVTYNGLTLTTCLKMESRTNISFTAPSAGKLTLVFGGTTAASGKSVKINGTEAKVGSDGTVTVDVAKGAVTVTKGDAINLFYMVYTPDGTTEETHTHNYVSKVTKEATCTEAGVLTYTCTSTTGTCDKKTYTEAIPAKGHSFSTEWTIDVEPTETTPGSKSHHCTVCDAKTDVTEIPATGVVEEPLAISVTKTETEANVTFTAEATGGKEGYTYKFIVYNRTTKTWGLVQNFSSNNTCTWTKGSAGDREFYVDVKDAEGNIVRSEMLNVKMTAEATLTGKEAIGAGEKLTLKAQSNVGAGCTYKFIIFNPATNQWFKLQDFSSNDTITWTAGNDGTRIFYVDVKDAAGNVTRSKALNVKIGTGSADKLTIKTTVSATTTKVGDKLTFTAEGNGGESGYTYKMVVYNRTTKIWGLVQNFNSNNTITWTAGTEGDREFYIDVKDAAGNVTRSAMMNVKTTK